MPTPTTRLGADLLALAKPRITMMVLATTATGWYVAPGASTNTLTFLTLAGVALVVAGANALNMYLERDVDARMRRTQGRPLPSGRMAPRVALAFGLATGIFAVVLLSIVVNPLTGILSALSFLTYVLWYTPMKLRSTAALLVGAIPGAMPPLLGWTAATNRVDLPGVCLFLILYLWQIPHFIAISIFAAEDYARAGIKVIPTDEGPHVARQRISVYTLLLVVVSLQAIRLHPAGPAYTVVAIALGAGFVLLALAGFRPRAGERWARALFRYSLVYLPVLLGALVFAVRVR